MSLSERIKKLAGLGSATSNDVNRAKVIAVAAQKGGVGKTTTAVNLALAMAKFQDLKTLLVDLDGQGHVAASLASITPDIIAAIEYFNRASFKLAFVYLDIKMT